jgi:hypothetical protein
MVDPAVCEHPHRQLIAKDQDAEFIECLDCGIILEAGELGELREPAGFNESLADA